MFPAQREIASPEYCNLCLTFSSKHKWVELSDSIALQEKVKKMIRAPDFEAATKKILQVTVNAKLKPSDIPDLIVFSEIQFDAARRMIEAL